MEIPTTLWRGGTSKACFFRAGDLPDDPALRDQFVLAAYGSPDPLGRQLDGIGGGVSSTSKVAVIGTNESDEVLYDFGQVDIQRAVVDRGAPCGNIASAVGPFAIDAGLVPATDPLTVVSIRDVNNGLFFRAHVPTVDGRFDDAGDTAIAGVPRRGSRIELELVEPGGALTGRLLPTGEPLDEIALATGEVLTVSIVDSAGLVVFVCDSDFGGNPWRPVAELNADPAFLNRVEDLRSSAAVKLGIAPDRATATRDFPAEISVAIIGPGGDYLADTGEMVQSPSEVIALRSTTSSMGAMHRTYPVTGALCLASAAAIPGTVVAGLAGDHGDAEIAIGSPAGLVLASACVEVQDGVAKVRWARCVRTARRIMQGILYCPDHYLVPRHEGRE